MHEQAYVQNIIEAATKHGKVEALTLEVGDLAPIPVHELVEALKFTEWNIRLLNKPGTVQCACGFLGTPTILEKGHSYTLYACPECKANMPPIIDGKDIIVKDVTVA